MLCSREWVNAACLEERLHLDNAAFERLRSHQAREAEHAGLTQFLPAAGNQCPVSRAVGPIQREAIEIE